MNRIPLVDLYDQYKTIKSEIDSAIAKVITNSAFVGGQEVRLFEQEFAEFCEASSCVGVGNGTDALYLTLRALGIGRGDEVITVAHTFIATAEAVSMTGALPVFVEINCDTLLMDPAAIEPAITERTRAIVPVHLYGQSCDMDAILDTARRYDLKVVEDAAQAHGARWRDQRVGSMADAATFSFYPGKNLGAFGDAGAVVSQDDDLIERVRMLANHGRFEKYTHKIEGVNSRLDGLQAAVLRVKLRHLEDWNQRRREHADFYIEYLTNSDLRPQIVHQNATPVWHLFVVRTTDRESLQDKLEEAGIATGIHYPVPLHLQPAYEHRAMAVGTLPTTEKISAEVLSLPMYPELTTTQLEKIVEVISTSTVGA